MAFTWFALSVIFGIIYLFLYYLDFYKKWKNGPPGPIPIPLFGNILEMVKLQFSTNPSPPGPHIMAMMSKKYGDVWRLRMGAKDFVVCSSVSTINRFMGRDEASGRDLSGLLYDRVDGQNTGIVCTTGPVWERNRKWAFKNLNMLGMRKRGGGLLSTIYDQLSPILAKFEEALSLKTGLEVSPLFLLPVTKTVFRFIMGNRLNEKEVEHQLEKCIEESEKMAKSTALTGGIDVAFPFLRLIAPELMGRNQIINCNKAVRKVAQSTLNEAREKKEEETLATLFLKEMDDNPEDTLFSDFHFGTIFYDLLQAASDTTNSYIQFNILNAVLYPKLQEKIYEELISVVGSHGDIELEDRQKCPYTDAFMFESHRFAMILPNFIPHQVTKEFKCEKTGYVIPKGTNVISDMFTANSDDRIFKNPEQFYPERFIENPELKKFVLPFGAGKRVCPGEAIGEWTAFIFFTNIIRKYKISQVPGSGLTKDHVEIGITCTPKPFSIRISKRIK